MLSWTAQCVSRERGREGRGGQGRAGKSREGQKPENGCRDDEARQHVWLAVQKLACCMTCDSPRVVPWGLCACGASPCSFLTGCLVCRDTLVIALPDRDVRGLQPALRPRLHFTPVQPAYLFIIMPCCIPLHHHTLLHFISLSYLAAYLFTIIPCCIPFHHHNLLQTYSAS